MMDTETTARLDEENNQTSEVSEADRSLSAHTSYYLKTITPTLMQHMHTEPVIQQLLTHGLLNTLDCHCLQSLFVSKQVEYLIDKVLLPGDVATLNFFLEALRFSAYHVNLNLAHLVDAGLQQQTDTGNLSEVFLSSQERDEMIETFYQPFMKTKASEDLIKHLESTQVIDSSHMQKIRELNHDERAGYLFDEVLLRGTYQTLQGFYQALTITGQEELAQLLPKRKTVSKTT